MLKEIVFSHLLLVRGRRKVPGNVILDGVLLPLALRSSMLLWATIMQVTV